MILIGVYSLFYIKYMVVDRKVGTCCPFDYIVEFMLGNEMWYHFVVVDMDVGHICGIILLFGNYLQVVLLLNYFTVRSLKEMRPKISKNPDTYAPDPQVIDPTSLKG